MDRYWRSAHRSLAEKSADSNSRALSIVQLVDRAMMNTNGNAPGLVRLCHPYQSK